MNFNVFLRFLVLYFNYGNEIKGEIQNVKEKNYNSINHSGFAASIMPEAFADTTEQPPQMPTQSQGEQPPAKPDGDQSDGEQPPQMPNGEQPQGDMNVSIPFTDVASDAWYYNVIVSQAYGKGLISGMSDIEFFT